MSKEKILYCNQCDDFVQYEVIEEKETYNIMDKEEITINAKIAICEKCNNKLFHEEFDTQNQKKAFDIYRKNNNLLFPEEIKNIRKKYNLTQKQMSNLLGWGEITYHRYEKGCLPDQAHNNQMMLIKEPLNVYRILKSGNHNLDIKIEKKLRNRVSELINGEHKKDLTINLPSDLYRKIQFESEKYGMKTVKEYVLYLLTKYHYEEKMESVKKQTKRETERKILKQIGKYDEQLYSIYFEENDNSGEKKNFQYDQGNKIRINEMEEKYVF